MADRPARVLGDSWSDVDEGMEGNLASENRFPTPVLLVTFFFFFYIIAEEQHGFVPWCKYRRKVNFIVHMMNDDSHAADHLQ